jgi:AcrR family transcriptional regulator
MTTDRRKRRPTRSGRRTAPASPRSRAVGTESRERILTAAETLFAQRGFKGTTTRDLAAAAGLHEAILFRHFPRKEDLYRQVLERKLSRNRGAALDEMAQAAAARHDRRFFETLARGLLTRFEEDAAIPRLILHSALEGYEPPQVVTERQLRVERPTLDYIVGRMKDGAFRQMDPEHAVVTFGAMLFGYIVRQHIVGMDAYRHHDREAVVESFVTIFLDGMKAPPPTGRAATDTRRAPRGRRR